MKTFLSLTVAFIFAIAAAKILVYGALGLFAFATEEEPSYCDYMAATTHAFATLRDNDGFSTNHFIFAFDTIILESNNLLDRDDLKFVAGLVDSVDLPPDTLADTVYEQCLKEQ